MSSFTPISSLSPDTYFLSTIRAVVTLVWPYSTNQKPHCALLLAEEDPRLRQAGGQIRVRFSGPAATAVAKSGIGITDVVVLSLGRSRWLNDTVRTPGKSVAGELSFTRSLELTIVRLNSDPVHINVDEHEDDLGDKVPGQPQTPIKFEEVLASQQSNYSLHYGSPSFSDASAPQRSTKDSFLDAMDDDGNLDRARKRLRVSFGTVRDWRMAARSPSPGQRAVVSLAEHSTKTSPSPVMEDADVATIQSPEAEASQSGSIQASGDLMSLREADPVPKRPTAQATADEPLHRTSAEKGSSEAEETTANKLGYTGNVPEQQKEVEEATTSSPPIIEARGVSPNPSQLLPGVQHESTMRRAMNSLFGFAVAPIPAVPVEMRDNSLESHKATASDFELAFETIRTNQEEEDDLYSVSDRASSPKLATHIDVGSVKNVLQPLEEYDASLGTSANEGLGLSAEVLADGRETSFVHWYVQQPAEEAEVHLKGDNPEQISHSTQPDALHTASTTLLNDLKSNSPLSEANPGPIPPPNTTVVTGSTSSHEDATEPSTTPQAFIPVRQEPLLAKKSSLDANSPRRSSIRAFFQQRHLEEQHASGRRSNRSSLASDMLSHDTSLINSSKRPQASPNSRLRVRTVSENAPLVQKAETTSPRRIVQEDAAQRHDGATTATYLYRDGPDENARGELSSPANVDSPPTGLRTNYAYYTKLNSLSRYVNPTGYAAFGGNPVDVMAVVIAGNEETTRAKHGPRDFYTTFHITDETINSGTRTPVDVFRPHRPYLPVTSAGDVVLLRAFTVKSRSHTPCLLSGNSSAWCVWRYSQEGVTHAGKENQPILSENARPAVHEHMSGPMVEFYEHERERANELHMWWLNQQAHAPLSLTDKTAVNGVERPMTEA